MMNYHYRYDKDGTCEIICTRCFLTIGNAHSLAGIRAIEAQHRCSRVASERHGQATARISSRERWFEILLHRIEHLRRFPENAKTVNLPSMFLLVGLLLYAVPTAIEFLAIWHLSPWLVAVLFGDVTGCVCLTAALKMPRTGVLLYLTLTITEGLLYRSHYLSPTVLIWIVDLIPTIVAASRIAYTQRAVVTFRSVGP
jgi:hypothetical protein